jgi:hypothetical protein
MVPKPWAALQNEAETPTSFTIDAEGINHSDAATSKVHGCAQNCPEKLDGQSQSDVGHTTDGLNCSLASNDGENESSSIKEEQTPLDLEKNNEVANCYGFELSHKPLIHMDVTGVSMLCKLSEDMVPPHV